MKAAIAMDTGILLRARRAMLGLFLAALACTWALPPAQAQTVSLPDFAELAERVGPSVVNIRTTERSRSGSGAAGPQMDEEMQEFFRRFFGVPLPGTPGAPGPRSAPRQGQPEETPRGVGSGFVISADGFVMTNAHVVEGADEVYVTLTDKREFKARIVGSDRRTDVAVVKIEAAGLPAVRIGDVNRLRVGEWSWPSARPSAWKTP
jgi:serine protease Do